MAPLAPTKGISELGLEIICAEVAKMPQNQIEEEESKVSQRVLDVVSKYPKIEHITAYMK